MRNELADSFQDGNHNALTPKQLLVECSSSTLERKSAFFTGPISAVLWAESVRTPGISGTFHCFFGITNKIFVFISLKCGIDVRSTVVRT